MKFKSEVTKIPIWGETVPGNTGKSKSDVMHVDKTLTMRDVVEKYPGIWDKSTDQLGDLRGNDSMVWQDEIANGYAGETYSDVPFLAPYLVEGGRQMRNLLPRRGISEQIGGQRGGGHCGLPQRRRD